MQGRLFERNEASLIRARILADFRRNLGRNHTRMSSESFWNHVSMDVMMNTQHAGSNPRVPLCTFGVSTEDTYYICTLPRNHAGTHIFTDSMGMCTESEDCRAMDESRGYRPNGYQHTH